MSDLALQVSVEKDSLGRFLSFAQIVAQSRTIDEIRAQRAQIQCQIALQQEQLAAIQKSNLLAEHLASIQEKRLEIELLKEKREENEREERVAEMNRLKHLRNLLAEAILEFESLKAELNETVTC